MKSNLARLLGSLAILVAAFGCGSSKSGGTGAGGAPSAGGASGMGGTTGRNTGGILMLGGSPGTSGTNGTAGAGACHRNGEACTTPADCCADSTCNNTAGAIALNGCHPRCSKSSDCSTGCCVPFTNMGAEGICAEAIWCGCGMTDAKCGSTLPKCCDDQVCLAGDMAQSFYACKKRCTTNADCPTACCVAIPGINTSACLDKAYCP